MRNFLIYLFTLNTLTYIFYGIDKWRASHGKSRVAEFHLHLLAFLGGTPAAILGQTIFRHKTQKKAFQFITGLIVILQCILIALFLWQQ